MIPSRQLLALAAIAIASPAGQVPAANAAELTGYVQSALVAPESNGRGSDIAWFNEVRFAAGEEFGSFRLDAAYEFEVYRATTLAGSGTDWLDLQGSLSSRGRLKGRHRVDRLQLSWSTPAGIDAVLGRQAISWGTTAYLTPADPFAPFSPSDTFREYRRGIDAVRLRSYPGALSEIDLVLRLSRLEKREEWTVLGRVLTIWEDWEVSAWGGSLYGDAAVALGTAGEVAMWALRAEAAVRNTGGNARLRGALGVSHSFEIDARSLGLALEYQHDGLGAARREDFGPVLQSEEYRRGELQVPGRDQLLARAAYQVHPLWEISGLALWNLNTGSIVLSPGFSYSVSDEATLSGSVAGSVGDPIPEEALPADAEDRNGSVTVQLSFTLYF